MKKIAVVIIVILLSSWAIRPLFHDGYFPVHDNAQVSRVSEMTKSLSDGMLPVRYVSDLGFNYGYPIFNFYAPLSYYVGSSYEMFLGLDVLVATKMMMATGIVLAGLFMYLLASEFWGFFGGVISALLYVYAPYHALDAYVRGDITEMWAYAWIPLAFYGLWKTYQQMRWKYMVIGAVGFAGIIYSHNLTAMMIAPFYLLFTLVAMFIRRKEGWKSVLLQTGPIGMGLLLGAAYWIPVFFELHYTDVLSQVGGGFDFHDHFVCISQLWNSPWGYGGSVNGCVDGMSFMLGKAHLFLILFAIIVGIIIPRKEKRGFVILFATAGACISLFLTTSLSQPIWDLLKPMAFFQFPWRFILLAQFFISFVGGASFWYMKKRFIKLPILISYIYFVLAVVGIIALNQKLFVVKEYFYAPVSYFEDRSVIGWDISSPSSEYLPPHFTKPKNNKQLPGNMFQSAEVGAHISMVEDTSIKHSAIVTTDIDATIHISVAYFPTWHVIVDSHEVKPDITNTGLTIHIKKGRHVITVIYKETAVERVSEIVSVIGILILILGILYVGEKFTFKHSNEKKNR